MPDRRGSMLGMAAGMALSQARLPAEWRTYTDSENGRSIKQASANMSLQRQFDPKRGTLDEL